MCNIHSGPCEAAPDAELGSFGLTRQVLLLAADARKDPGAADVPAQPPTGPHQDQGPGPDVDVDEDVYEYDCPRAAPAPPTRRTLSDISGPSAALGALSIDSLETSRSQQAQSGSASQQRRFPFCYYTVINT